MKITFAGDISLYRIDTNAFSFNDTCKELFRSSDLVIGNLECPLTSSDRKEDKAFNMSAPSSALALLKPFGVVSLANNHILDYGMTGLQDTLNALEASEIKYFGAGRTRQEALRPLKLDINGFKLAFIGATRFANASRDNSGGTANDNAGYMFKQIRKLKQEGFFVIMYLHWGYEYVRIPSPRDRRVAHRCVDSGADLVIGSHPHIYQGMELYKGKKIVYSLGNFIFHSSVFTVLAPDANDPRLNESFVFSIELGKDLSYTSDLIGYYTNDDGVDCYDQVQNSRLISEVEHISRIFTASYLNYMKSYYAQTREISRQNVRVTNEFQGYRKMSLRNKILTYKNANSQDVLNRLVGYFVDKSQRS